MSRPTLYNIHCHHSEAQLTPTHNTITINSWSSAHIANTSTDRLSYPCSIGLHPWHLSTDNLDLQLNHLNTTIEHNREHLVAIGECGYDTYAEASIATQRTAFEHQIALSERLHLPIIIHNVKCWDELLQSCHPNRRTIPVIIHGFRGKPTQAQQLIHHGYYLSFGRYYNPQSLTLAYQANRLLLETDESNITIAQQYNQAANTLSIASEQLAQTIETTIDYLFPTLTTHTQTE